MLEARLQKALVIYCFLSGAEAFGCAVYLLSLPVDPTNAWVGGYSLTRLSMVALFILLLILCLYLALHYQRQIARVGAMLKWFQEGWRVWGMLIVSLIVLIASGSISLAPPLWLRTFEYVYVRIRPLTFWLSLASAQWVIILLCLFRQELWLQPSSAVRRLSPGEALLWLLLGIACVLTALYYQGSRSPWVRFGVPFNNLYLSNPVYGYNVVYNADFHHKENIYPFRQMDMLKGNEFFAPIFTDKRIFYAFAGNLLTLVFNSYYALLFLNVILFYGAAFLLYYFSYMLFNSKAKAFLAAFLLALSILGVVHLGDTSPHIMAIFFYYLWGLLLLRIIVENRAITWQENVGLLAILGLWSLTYPGAFYGLLLYWLVLLKQKKYFYLIPPVLVFYVVPSLQLEIIASLEKFVSGITQIANEAGMVEATLAGTMVSRHLSALLYSPRAYLGNVFLALCDLILLDNPINVLIGLVGVFCLRHRAKWFLVALFFIPVLSSLFFFMQSGSRGYMAAGATLVIFTLVAHYVVEWGGVLRRQATAWAATLLVVFVLGMQIIWAHASALGVMFPAYAYAFGFSQTIDTLHMPRFVRYTGNLEDKPLLLYGSKTVNEYLGIDESSGKQPVFVQERRDLLAYYRRGRTNFLKNFLPLFKNLAICLYLQSLILLLMLVTMAIFLPKSSRGLVMGIFVILVLLTLFFSDRTGLDKEAYLDIDRMVSLSGGEGLRGKVQLSEDFVRLLETMGEDATVSFFLYYRSATDGHFNVYNIPSENRQRALNMRLDQFLTLLREHHNVVEFSLVPDQVNGSAFLVASWQKNVVLEGRWAEKTNVTGKSDPLEYFPDFEIRVLGARQLYGFIEKQPIELIGY